MRGRIRLGLISAAVAACAVVPALAAAESAASQYLYERTLMGAADGRCHLFAPDVGRALAAARAQARNAALRAGDSSAAVAATERRALDKAASVDCRAPGLKLAADRLRTAFSDYAKLQVMSFPGARGRWRAERPYPGYHGAPRWGLVQVAAGQGGWVLFGVADRQVILLDARRDSAPAPIARIVFRNPAILSEPYVDLRRSDPARCALAAAGRGQNRPGLPVSIKCHGGPGPPRPARDGGGAAGLSRRQGGPGGERVGRGRRPGGGPSLPRHPLIA
jgi:hypothetical protein